MHTKPIIDVAFNISLSHRLTTLDPWLPVDTNVMPPLSGMNYVDMSDEDLLNLFVTRITGQAVRGERGGLDEGGHGECRWNIMP